MSSDLEREAQEAWEALAITNNGPVDKYSWCHGYIAASDDKLQASAGLIEEQRSEIAAKDERIAALENENRILIFDNTTVISELREYASDLSSTIAARDETIVELKDQWTKQALTIMARDKTIEKLRAEVALLDSTSALVVAEDSFGEELAKLREEKFADDKKYNGCVAKLRQQLIDETARRESARVQRDSALLSCTTLREDHARMAVELDLLKRDPDYSAELLEAFEDRDRFQRERDAARRELATFKERNVELFALTQEIGIQVGKAARDATAAEHKRGFDKLLVILAGLKVCTPEKGFINWGHVESHIRWGLRDHLDAAFKLCKEVEVPIGERPNEQAGYAHGWIDCADAFRAAIKEIEESR